LDCSRQLHLPTVAISLTSLSSATPKVFLCGTVFSDSTCIIPRSSVQGPGLRRQFQNLKNSEPGGRSAKMPAAFFCRPNKSCSPGPEGEQRNSEIGIRLIDANLLLRVNRFQRLRSLQSLTFVPSSMFGC
jgi:hypothetical protein